jgi:hypothetical protein
MYETASPLRSAQLFDFCHDGSARAGTKPFFTASASHCNPTHFISDITQSFFFAPSSNVNARLNYISNQHPDQSTTRNPPRVIFPNHGELSFSCDLAEFGRQKLAT